ncbi:MAG TPA: tetratricopeptide repeat protein [Syntrophales bacterium]|nr:tetratricopeptide repeat protein [Syntrophales bacterium]
MTSKNEHGKAVLIGLALVIVTAMVFWQVGGFEFVRYDDDKYVMENPVVRSGLSLEGIRWAFRSFEQHNWHPLTWLSHMLDVQWFGLDAGRHHQVNLLFHILNTLILFIVLQRMTRALWKSAFVAALFALHPLHVESAAWIAERKDLLSAFFFLLALLAYERYTSRKGPGNYLLVVMLFALGLLSKPMVVTLPFVLLLLDFWPLGRFQACPPKDPASEEATAGKGIVEWIRINRGLFLEKIPLLVLSVVSCIVTIEAQRGAMKALESVPLGARVLNAVVAYAEYVYRCFVPVDLAVLYPYRSVTTGQVLAAALLLAAVTALVVYRRRNRSLMVGWFWYLGTLVPVIGLVQVGVQASADRYTYIPFIGLFVLLTWLAGDLSARLPHRAAVLATAALLILAGLSAATVSQTGYWVNSEALFEHALQATKDNYVVHGNFGAWLAGQGRMEEAVRQYHEALRIKPDDGDARYNLANMLARQARYPEAIAQYREVLKTVPDHVMARNNLALCLIQTDNRPAAIEQFREILRLEPGFAAAQQNLTMLLAAEEKIKRPSREIPSAGPAGGVAVEENMRLGQEAVLKGDLDSAIVHFRGAVRSNPDLPAARIGLGLALAYKGEIDEAIRQFRAALKLEPGNADVHNSLGVALMQKGQLDEAQTHLQKAIKINPRLAKAHNSLGVLLARKGKLDEAMEQFSEALRIDPENRDAEKNMTLVQNLKAKSK